MSSIQSWSALLVGAMLLGSFLAGSITGDVVTDEPDPEELVSKVVAGAHEFETLHGVRTVERETHRLAADRAETWTVRKEIWIRQPDQARIEVRSSTSNASASGDVTLHNGSTLKRYKSADERMLVDPNWDADVSNFDPSPVVDEYEIEYVGTATVAGRETYVVEIEPGQSVQAALTFHLADQEFDVMTVRSDGDELANVSYTTTWWIDTETTYPLKERVEIEYDDPMNHPARLESDVTTVVYEDVEFDGDIPDERFTLDPPPGTEVYEVAEPLGVDTIDEADAAAPFSVPDPPVPERFQLIHVSGHEFDDDVTVTVLYRDGMDIEEDDSIWVRFTERPPGYDEADVLKEGVGEIDGTVVEKPLGTTLIYECDDTRIEITPDLDSGDDVALAIEIAESMGCS